MLPLIWVRTENIITLVHWLTDLTLIFLLPLFFISLVSKREREREREKERERETT